MEKGSWVKGLVSAAGIRVVSCLGEARRMKIVWKAEVDRFGVSAAGGRRRALWVLVAR